MKPSERIKEIKRANKSMLMSEDYKWIDSVITYLDEEHEKVKKATNKAVECRKGECICHDTGYVSVDGKLDLCPKCGKGK